MFSEPDDVMAETVAAGGAGEVVQFSFGWRGHPVAASRPAAAQGVQRTVDLVRLVAGAGVVAVRVLREEVHRVRLAQLTEGDVPGVGGMRVDEQAGFFMDGEHLVRRGRKGFGLGIPEQLPHVPEASPAAESGDAARGREAGACQHEQAVGSREDGSRPLDFAGQKVHESSLANTSFMSKKWSFVKMPGAGYHARGGMSSSEILPVSGREAPKKPASYEISEVLAGLKAGEKDSAEIALFDRSASRLKPEQKQALVDFLVSNERCSPEFAQNFFGDAAFRQRVMKLCRKFAEHGESMRRLEEAEIYTSLMDRSSDDIEPLLQATDLTRSFSGLKKLNPEEMREQRINEWRGAVEDMEESDEKAYALNVLRSAFESAGLRENDWASLFANRAAMDKILNHEPLQHLYEVGLGGKMDLLHRRIELRWKTDPRGERFPVMGVGQLARNERTGEVSRLGFEIELERRVNPETGKIESRRVAKEGVIVIDQDARNKQDGIRFLLDKLGLVKKYKLDEMEFKANIQIGSYVWARLADMDVPTTAHYFLEEKDLAGLGPEPWDGEHTKRAKALVFERHILPAYQKNFESAIRHMPEEMRSQHEAALRAGLATLEEKAKAGVLTMEELADFGKGLDLVGFTGEGLKVSSEDPSAKQKGHIGKASIMGVPWLARLPLDRRSLSRAIDKLNKGRPISSLLMKAGLYLLH